MKTTGQTYLHPVESHPESKREHYKPRPLKSLSIKTIWILLESIEYQLENKIFLPQGVIKALEKRKNDLTEALDERLEWEDHMCEVYSIRDDYGRPQKIIWIDSHLGPNTLSKDLAYMDLEGDPPRKSNGKAFFRGRRLRPGKKTVYFWRPKMVN